VSDCVYDDEVPFGFRYLRGPVAAKKVSKADALQKRQIRLWVPAGGSFITSTCRAR
jgi:hypothetical protein